MLGISGSQIRAARGLLNWSQSDLAERAGVTRSIVQKIENDEAVRADNFDQIRSTLKRRVIFLDGDGVKKMNEELKHFSGIDGCDAFYANVVNAIRQNGGELLCDVRDSFLSYRTNTGQTNLERLEQLSETISVKIILQSKVARPARIPTVETRVLHELPQHLFTTFVYNGALAMAYKSNDGSYGFAVIHAIDAAHGGSSVFHERWALACPSDLLKQPLIQFA